MRTAFTIDAPIKAVAPWGGSKRGLAPTVIHHLGDHDEFDEWFVGGCSILPAKPRSRREFLNDANPFLINDLRCVRDYGPELGDWLRRFEFDLSVFTDSQRLVESSKIIPTEKDEAIQLAAHQLVTWWMGASGFAGTTTRQWFAKRNSKSGGDPSVRWNSFRRSLPALSNRILGAEITNLDFRELATRRKDRRGLAIYADPPYFKKAFEYLFEADVDSHGTRKTFPHRKLAEILNGYALARVVVSYYDETGDGSLFGGSLLDELYPPDRWERFEYPVSKASANAREGAARTAATEVLLVNGRA